MGAHQLHLIQPQCEITYDAQQMAANGQEGLANRKVYTHWDEFLDANPDGIRIALTARDGRARTLHDLKSGLQFIAELPEVKRASLNKIYLIFGPEDCGLAGEEIDRAHFACSLPTYGENWSLNLAQAVLLALFILRDTWGGQRTTLDGQHRPREINDSARTKTKNILPDKVLRDWIETLGFDISKRRINAYTVLRRILLHNVPSTKELRILEAVLQQTLRKLKEHKAAYLAGKLKGDAENNRPNTEE
jgi:tRNA/rRNA methyltransferase